MLIEGPDGVMTFWLTVEISAVLRRTVDPIETFLIWKIFNTYVNRSEKFPNPLLKEIKPTNTNSYTIKRETIAIFMLMMPNFKGKHAASHHVHFQLHSLSKEKWSWSLTTCLPQGTQVKHVDETKDFDEYGLLPWCNDKILVKSLSDVP